MMQYIKGKNYMEKPGLSYSSHYYNISGGVRERERRGSGIMEV